MKKIYLIIFFFTSILSAQNDRVKMYGVITNDSIFIENVHIINKTTNKGTLSNQSGEFKITVKENDTIRFSNIQYQTKWVIITKKQINSKILKIRLFQKNNKLPEVVLENMAKSLGLPNADKEPLNKLERNLNAYSQKSTPMVFLDALLLGPILNNIPFVKQRKGGIDDIYNIVSGNRKRDRKLKYLLDKDKKNEITKKYIVSIRDYFQDDFFINTLHIPKENINIFLNYCIPKNIIFLFDKKRYLDLVDIFLTESKAFKNN